MSFSVRRATADDKPEWLRMRLLLWPEVGSPGLVEDMDRMLADTMTPVFVLERPNGQIGRAHV